MEPVGIEGDVVMFREMAGQQTDEADEDFLDALGRLSMHDGALLGVLQVEQEDRIEHAQHLALVDVVGVQVADDFAHLRPLSLDLTPEISHGRIVLDNFCVVSDLDLWEKLCTFAVELRQ